MRIHKVIPDSTVNGPGKRAVIWVQGCIGMECPGCWNQDTHNPSAGSELSAIDIAVSLMHLDIEGITISGGEPMQQTHKMAELINIIRASFPQWSIGMFSGYSESELDAGAYWSGMQDGIQWRAGMWAYIKTTIDFAVLGRYNRLRPATDDPMVTSTNQKLCLYSDRYSAADFGPLSVEVTIDRGGLTSITGFPTKGNLI